MLRTALSRRRRLIAAVLLSAAAAIAVLQISPGSHETVPTVVAARALGAGTVLSAQDLRVAEYPVSLAPAASPPAASTTGVSPEESAPGQSAPGGGDPDPTASWVGRTLASAVVEGQPLTGPSVLGPDLLSGQPAGSTAVTVRVADAAALTHVRPGQHVDLISTDADALAAADAEPPAAEDAQGDRAEAPDSGADSTLRVAAQLPVLWVADPAAPADGLLASAPEVQADLLVVGADAATAERIASAPEGELVPVLVAAPADAEPADGRSGVSPSAEASGR